MNNEEGRENIVFKNLFSILLQSWVNIIWDTCTKNMKKEQKGHFHGIKKFLYFMMSAIILKFIQKKKTQTKFYVETWNGINFHKIWHEEFSFHLLYSRWFLFTLNSSPFCHFWTLIRFFSQQKRAINLPHVYD